MFFWAVSGAFPDGYWKIKAIFRVKCFLIVWFRSLCIFSLRTRVEFMELQHVCNALSPCVDIAKS